MTQRQAIRFTRLQLLEQFRSSFPELVNVAENSDLTSFKSHIGDLASASNNTNAAQTILSLLQNDGKTVKELSTGEDIRMGIIYSLYSFLRGDDDETDYSADALLDVYYQLCRLDSDTAGSPDKKTVSDWMERWPSGLESGISDIMERNRQRIMHYLVEKVSGKSNRSVHYRFEDGLSYQDKFRQVSEWWNDYRFHIAMAARSPKEINQLLGGTISKENYAIMLAARHKGMPFFLTPYYASLMNPEHGGYDDYAIRSYVLYPPELVHTYGSIRAWEKEDEVKGGEPNAAGWIVPDPQNIHRRYPDVAILIPDTMGRSCGGLCASCQRMYGFQNRHLHFDLQELQPKENWPHKLHRLMEYFENDSQIRDILITGGDALMSQNKSLEKILSAVCDMAERKRKANLSRPDGEKYAEMQRIRLGTRLPVYLPMRINDELVDILSRTKEKGTKAGIMPDGRRVLCFDHDGTRKHSPIIERIGMVYILENKSVASYLRQLDMIGENSDEYSSIWEYTSSVTEPRASVFRYPEYDFAVTDTITNYVDRNH